MLLRGTKVTHVNTGAVGTIIAVRAEQYLVALEDGSSVWWGDENVDEVEE